MEKLIVFALILLGSVSESWANYCEKSPLYQKLKGSCTDKIIHLTFDDGPDPKTTPLILKALNDKGVKSTFYISTTHLKDGVKNETLMEMLKTGHVVGSHGHLHNAHDLRLVKTDTGYKSDPQMFTANESRKDIQKSLELLKKATGGLTEKQKHLLFRFPYGRGASPSALELQAIMKYGSSKKLTEKEINDLKKDNHYTENLKEYRSFKSEALQRLYSEGQDHVGWNFDSEDSVTNVAKSAIANHNWYRDRIVTRMCKDPQKALMALFHDYNKSFNAKALPEIIEIGRCLGLKFVSYDEILKEKSYLERTGVLQLAPRLNSGQFKEVIQVLNQKIEPDIQNTCHEKIETSFYHCQSSNGKTYNHCQGEASVCIYGKWVAKTSDLVDKFCSEKKCYSEYTKTYYSQCQGKSSVCIGGDWYQREHELVKEVCR